MGIPGCGRGGKDEHPFWLPDFGKWVNAEDLEPGMWLQTSAGTWVQITAIDETHRSQRVHNLTVDGQHTYYVVVGSAAVLVHNISLPCEAELEEGLDRAKNASSGFKDPGGMSGYTRLNNGVSSNLTSGGNGRNLRPDWEAPPGTTNKNFHHLENQTAALMRKTGATEGYLYLHKAEGAAYGPCPGVDGCLSNMRAMLPAGSKLMVIWRNGSGATRNQVFIGGAD
ncbi:DddA-like double-stranded DNA deaminase toxin [Streptomyces yanii]|uniref:DddA-like double-stranded DNA deaminase toxin n=1 Tax=Streptomyces yanii TaxID=78510 RepID=A0ABV5R863_9ACTN